MKPVHAFAAALLATVSVPAAAQAQGPTVAEFLKRVQILMLGGEVSPDSPAYQAMLAEVAAAGKDVRARQAADHAAGRPATFCLPPRATAETDLVTYLQKIPAARQNAPFREAFAEYTQAKYPCPKR